MSDKFLQFLGLTKKSGNLLEGYNKCEEALKKNKGFLIIISSELSENSKKKFYKYCSERNIPIIDTYGKLSLSEVLGRKEINVVCVIDKGMSDQLQVLHKSIDTNRG